MEPQYLLFIVGALACPLLMGGAMWLMMRQGGQMQMGGSAMPREKNIAALQAERQALNQEIRELEQLQQLEERRRELARQQPAENP